MNRMQPYWEQVRNELADILEVMVRSETEPIWEEVRKDAVANLYVKGIFHVVPWT